MSITVLPRRSPSARSASAACAYGVATITTSALRAAEAFIRASREGWEKGVSILHFLGGSSVEVVGARAITQTKMTISQRAAVDGVLCDVVCTGRFYDFIEKRAGRWGIVLRQPIYEKDRLDVVDPAATLALDRSLLESFPQGYRHLAYLQTKVGYKVKPDMPGLHGPVVQARMRAEKLGSMARRWPAEQGHG